MSWKTILVILILILVVFGISRFFGYVKEKQEGSTTYLQETVDTVETVNKLKDDRAKKIKEQESSLDEYE